MMTDPTEAIENFSRALILNAGQVNYWLEKGGEISPDAMANFKAVERCCEHWAAEREPFDLPWRAA